MNNLVSHIDIQDASFDPAAADTYHALFLLNQKKFVTAIAGAEGKLLLLKSFHFTPSITAGAPPEELDGIFADKRVFLRNFSSVKLAVSNQYFSLAPSALAGGTNAEASVRFNHVLEGNFSFFSTPIPALNIEAAFAIEQWQLNFFRKQYAGVKFYHSGIPFLSAAFSSDKSAHQHQLYLNVESRAVELAFFNENGLRYYNRFPFRTTRDFIYFVLLVMDELKLDSQTPVVLSGDIDYDSTLYDSLSSYIKTLTFFSDPGGLTLTPAFDVLAPHHYLTLFNLNQCV